MNLKKKNHETSNLYTLLTSYDENSIAPQTKGIPTLLDIIRGFGEDYINTQATIGNLIVVAAGATSTQSAQFSGYPILFRNAVPQPNDTLVAAEFTAKVASTNLGAYIPTTVNQATSPDTCPVPIAKLIDHLYQAGDRSLDDTVTICPVYQQGMMNCHYPVITSGITSYGVTQADTANGNALGKLSAYFIALYSMVYNAYKPGSIDHLAPDKLDFFEDESLLSFGSDFQIDLGGINIYMTNINPNTNAPVMCTVGNLTIDYSQCTDPNFAALQDHVNTDHTYPGPIVVPADNQIDWNVNRNMMAAGVIFSYASTSRPLAQRFMAILLDNLTSCLSSSLSADGRVCNQNSQGSLAATQVISPWLNGYWNPYDKCDVTVEDLGNGYQEFIDIQCQNTQIHIHKTRHAIISATVMQISETP